MGKLRKIQQESEAPTLYPWYRGAEEMSTEEKKSQLFKQWLEKEDKISLETANIIIFWVLLLSAVFIIVGYLGIKLLVDILFSLLNY